MRSIIHIVRTAGLKVSDKRKRALAQYLRHEIQDATRARFAQEQAWKRGLQLYESIPSRPARKSPIVGAPNISVPLTATACDLISAQASDLLFTPDQILCARPTQGKYEETANILQRWFDHSVDRRYRLRDAGDDGVLDTTIMGTAVYHIPYIRRTLKRRDSKVVYEGPEVQSIPIEDFFVPGGIKCNIDSAPLVTWRTWYDKRELKQLEKIYKWDISECEVSSDESHLRTLRNRLGRTDKAMPEEPNQFEIHRCWVQWDIDGDGTDEDLLVVFDRASGSILKLDYCPYDMRPFTSSRYQRRAHLFYGMGVPEMLVFLQIAATKVVNYWLLNMMLSNSRAIITRPGVLDEDQEIYPFKIMEVSDPEAVKFLQMADVYQSGPQALGAILGMGDRRVGTNQSGEGPQRIGTRTPGITTLSTMQEQNRRFSTAFDSMKAGLADAGMQCVFREAEEIRADPRSPLMNEMVRVLGEADAGKLATCFMDDHFDEQVCIEMTATSPTDSREADRQNSMLLMDRMFGYYKGVMEIAQVAANPAIDQNIRTVAMEVADRGNKMMLKVLNTFDKVRDPEGLLVKLGEGVGTLEGGAQDQIPALAAPGGADALGSLFELLKAPQAGAASDGGIPPMQ